MAFGSSPVVQTPPSWSKRNYRWLVPVICIGGILAILLCAGLTYWLKYGRIKSTAIYKEIVARARTNSAVIQALGTPITEGLPIAVHGRTRSSADEMLMNIPLSGPNGSGSLFFAASKSQGHWTNEHLTLMMMKPFQAIDLDAPKQSVTNH